MITEVKLVRTLAELDALFAQNGGLLHTKQLTAAGIHYPQLQQLLSQGILEKVCYGCYRYTDRPQTPGQTVAALFPDAVLCLQSAFYVHGYEDFAPDVWHLAVEKDSSKSRFQIDYPFVKPYYTDPAVLSIGITECVADGAAFRVFDRDRTAVDALRYRNKLPAALVRTVLTRYAADKNKNLTAFHAYANQLHLAKSAQGLLWLLPGEELL